jgi:hypothetical protein
VIRSDTKPLAVRSVYAEPLPAQQAPLTWKFAGEAYWDWPSWFLHLSVGVRFGDFVSAHIGIGPAQLDIGWYYGEWK